MRDRVVHQALFRVLYHPFDRHFIHDSYSCRFNKGVHSGVNRLTDFARKVSRNYRQPAYALQGDVKKFFDSIGHNVLFNLIKREITDNDILNLLKLIISSFETTAGRGLPLGNVTSQLFANIYLNELDQFVKHELRERYYLRYCDDFVILHPDLSHLKILPTKINDFLQTRLGLELHPRKLSIRKLSWGIDWLGYVIRPHYRVLRVKTRQRIEGRLARGEIDERNSPSYLGMLKHCRGYKMRQLLLKS